MTNPKVQTDKSPEESLTAQPIWTPSPERIADSNLSRFLNCYCSPLNA